MGQVNLFRGMRIGPNPVTDVEISYDFDSCLTWHLLFRTLHRGAPDRLGLPPELVHTIFRASDIRVPHRLMETGTINAIVDGDDNMVSRKPILVSPPMTPEILSRARALTLQTLSTGTAAEEIMTTWFELCVAEPRLDGTYDIVELEHTVLEASQGEAGLDEPSHLRWRSHHNPVSPRGSPEPQWMLGIKFGEEHEIWQHLRVGRVLLVDACALFTGIDNHVSEARLWIWKNFEPVVY